MRVCSVGVGGRVGWEPWDEVVVMVLFGGGGGGGCGMWIYGV